MFRSRITAVLTVAIFGISATVNAQYPARPDPGQQDSQTQQQSVPPQPQEPAQPQQSAEQGQPAQDQTSDQQRGVARLSIVQGDVNVKRGDSGELVAAVMNAPVMMQDHVQTSPGSRAEVQLDYANMIRLAPNTDLGFADLEYQRYQVQLGTGTIIYRVLRDSSAHAEVDTPSVAVRPTQQGDYRISVLEDGSTQITVRSGELEVYSPRGTQRLQAGRTMLVRGDSSDPEFQMTDQIAPDQLDDWSANRDRQLLASQSYQHVSRDIYGADDLDNYGNWVPSQYGNVWEPQTSGTDWAPYSDGQWVSEPYYGWTWVDAAPWGWAPYHYGRWFWNGGHGWCWWPGSIFSSYLWSPALVGFFGWGGGLGIGLGGLGWVALAPFELFHPWWGHGFHDGFFGRDRYGRGEYGRDNFGTLRNANIAGMYRNAAVRGGAITAAANSFGRGRMAFGRATQSQLRNGTAFHGQIPVAPTQASHQFSNRQASANPRLASAANRQFFQHQSAPQSARGLSAVGAANTRGGGFARAGQTGFSTAQRGPAPAASRGGFPTAPQNSGGVARNNSAPQNLHGVPPNLRAQTRGRTNYGASPQTSSRGSNSGWQRFGEPGTSSAFRGTTAPREQSGWHSFGQPQAGYSRSFTSPNYGGNYQSRPLGPSQPAARPPQSSSGYRGGYNYGARPAYGAPGSAGMGSYRAAPSMPHYSAPSAPHFSAPSAPHYSAPHSSAPRGGGGGGSFHGGGGGAPHGGGGSHGGGHSSSGGHRSR